jgi:hypothetical protein
MFTALILSEMVGKTHERPINNFKMLPEFVHNFWKLFRAYLAKQICFQNGSD